MLNTDINIIEIGITILSAAGALFLGKLHLPKATAQEVKKILDITTSDINNVNPGSKTASLVDIVDKIADCGLQQGNKDPDLNILKLTIIEVLKELNINIDYKAEHVIEAVLTDKTNKNIQPKG